MVRVIVCCILLPLSTAIAGTHAMFESQGTPFTAAGQAFSVVMPPDWAAVESPVNTAQFVPTQLPGHGTLFIRKINVPGGAHPRQLLLNSIDGRLSKLPNVRITRKRNLVLAGMPAASVVGEFDFQGNAQYPRTFEELYVVSGSDAYIFHFECSSPVASAYAPALNTIYSSFQPQTSASQSAPFAVPQEEAVDDLALPF